jgi:hypothetical protein
MAALGIRADEGNFIFRNDVLVAPRAQVSDGDRVAFFTPNFVHPSQFYLVRREDYEPAPGSVRSRTWHSSQIGAGLIKRWALETVCVSRGNMSGKA